MVFAGTPSANSCLTAVLGLFAAALPRAAKPGSLSIDLSAMAVAQAATSWWFTHLDQADESAPDSSHDGPWGMSYLALTLAVSWALHTADTACSWMVSAVLEELGSLAVSLGPLFVPRITRTDAHDPRPFVDPRTSQRGPSPHGALLADAVVRRGPPRRRRP